MRSESRFTARYAETDQMGIIHHSVYPIWFEVGRTDFLKKTGISNESIESRGVILPLYGLDCQYKSPARYADEILVITTLCEMTRVRMCFSYQVFHADSLRLLATGQTMHAWTDKSLKPINLEKVLPDVYSAFIKFKGE